MFGAELIKERQGNRVVLRPFLPFFHFGREEIHKHISEPTQRWINHLRNIMRDFRNGLVNHLLPSSTISCFGAWAQVN